MSRIFLLIGIILFILENSVSLLSIKEKQYLAARRSFLLSMLLSFPFLFLSVINFPYQNIIGLSLTLLAGVFLVLLLIPFPSKKDKNYKKPITRIDERDTMFSRNRLKKGSTHYKNYYLENPDKKEIDDKIRSNPGLLAKNTKYYHNYWFQAADTNFAHVKQLRSKVDGKVSSSKSKFALSSKSNTAFIKNWLRNLNVLDTGITLLKDYHIYSYGGRDERYGKKLTLEHKFAIAFTIPMNYELVNCAPQASMVFESSRCYLQSAQIAITIAQFIRSLGYSARAHIDGNYKVVCPLVAKDAGLGEIGRMGILITPSHGPRVRIAVVTTDLPLDTDHTYNSSAIIDFCEICKKCARICPSNSIPFDSRKDINGVKRWKINQETCFQFWTTIGTDCGQCMRVCPFSHPHNFFHNLIRKRINSSPLFRRFAVVMDDFFYGKYPHPAQLPD